MESEYSFELIICEHNHSNVKKKNMSALKHMFNGLQWTLTCKKNLMDPPPQREGLEGIPSKPGPHTNPTLSDTSEPVFIKQSGSADLGSGPLIHIILIITL